MILHVPMSLIYTNAAATTKPPLLVGLFLLHR